MYLKSLVLKGFKSFADRSVLTVEPGITAIVGPNGSGKSNISDAVLWVLGERSAKNLRGQAMEDIIFAGSAARKAVSTAEVELVLDNSDGTIPIDYDEVSIARRMYRSGESDYLVNGSVVRRLDVLDILHDSGLGTGTHSIISQGSLDSILQSKPEDRRSLIEEAAGVLKHKQRKEKSARKLEAMDHHLDRARDVTAEIERQLKPLERKAKRAEAYKQASAQLTDLKLMIAVDDLRNLQSQWKNICEAEKSAADSLDEKRTVVDAAEQNVSAVQEAMKRETEDANELARKQRRGAQIAERLDSCELLLRERRRSALDFQETVASSIKTYAERLASAQADHEAAIKQSELVSAQLDRASSEVESLSSKLSELGNQRRKIEEAIRENESASKRATSELDRAQKNRSAIAERLSSGRAHEKLVEARRHELVSTLDKMREDHDQAKASLEEAQKLLEHLTSEDAEAQAASTRLFGEREAAMKAHEDAVGRLRVIESELKALDAAQKASRQENPALTWLSAQSGALGSAIEPLVHVVRAPKGIESLVERLIGDDIAALAIEDEQSAEKAAELVVSQALSGDVNMFPRRPRSSSSAKAEEHASGTPLIDLLETTDGSRGLLEALFGDVVLCDTREEAFAAHANDSNGLRFVSKDGCVVWPSGKVRVFGASQAADEGVLARERRGDELVHERDACLADIESKEKERAGAEERYRDAQAASLKANQALASQKGAVSAAQAEERRASDRLQSAINELESVTAQYDQAQQTVSELQPKMEEASGWIEKLQAQIDEYAAEHERLSNEAYPLRSKNRELSDGLSAAKLEHATLAERAEYARRMVTARENDLGNIKSSARASRRSIAEKDVVLERAQQAISCIELLTSALRRRTVALDDALEASENATNTVHANAAKARDAARLARDDFDAASERMTQVRIEKSKLEVQVDAAVKAVVTECGVPLDKAQELPVLEDRQGAEDELFKVERRIKNMGTINPDAAEEYAALKERYDYLSTQLSDMEQARRSLRKIVSAIDERMKGDFERTFEQVNENFAEVFSTLFPGGTAKLVLEDPDDIENTGVEVVAQPRGKRLSKMMLMSGGEKSLTALALLFAVYKTRSTPFYILDEVEAALDDTNLRRLTAYIDSLRDTTQLIMITHQRRTMEMADVLFGVSMQADGVTKVISQKLERALEQAE